MSKAPPLLLARSDRALLLPLLPLLPLAALLLSGCAEPPEPAEPAATPAPETASVLPDPGPGEHLLYPPGEVTWQPAPASLQPEARVAILEGNPAEPGVFTMRISMPDGFMIAPHSHPNVERVTVLEGVFRLGTGPEVDREETLPLEAGSYTAMPPGMVHYAVAEGETVIQLTSVGPWIIEYVNPGDDPRNAEDGAEDG